jgi:GTP cyclohydrolase I
MVRLKIIKNRKKFQKERVPQIGEEFKLTKVVVEENTFNYQGVVALAPIEFSAKCEHHLVSIHGNVYFAYVPGRYIVGLSQIARIIESFLNVTTEIIQEEVTKKIADYFEKKLQPQGLWIVIKAKHECMTARGVRQRNCLTTTSEIRGVFWQQDLRQEVMSLWKL